MTARVCAALLACLAAQAAADRGGGDGDGWGWGRGPKPKRVLVLLIDGLHGFDLEYVLATWPSGAIAGLSSSGTRYSQAFHSGGSDSFPGNNYFFTGAGPETTGVWYEQTYDGTLYPPGSGCTGPAGTIIDYSEAISVNADDPYGGGGIDPATLPLRKAGNACTPVYPHQYTRVNNVYDVVKDRLPCAWTAYADKHQGYEFMQGASGRGVDDLNNVQQVPPYDKTPVGTQAYDNLKASIIINQIMGKISNGTGPAPVPTLFGANFQSVSVAQKANSSTSAVTGTLQAGGYVNAATPNQLTKEAIQFIDGVVGKIVAALQQRGLLDTTAIVLAGKHGNSPVQLSTLHRVKAGNFDTVAASVGITLATSQLDTGVFIWLSPADRAAGKATVLAKALNDAQAGGSTDLGIVPGSATAYLGGDPRHPDITATTQPGVLYSTKASKIADHGGYSEDDTHVALLTAFPGRPAGKKVVSRRVTTSQVAPTILRWFGLPGWLLDGVKAEGTQPLPMR